jgi:hypothetical protein
MILFNPDSGWPLIIMQLDVLARHNQVFCNNRIHKEGSAIRDKENYIDTTENAGKLLDPAKVYRPHAQRWKFSAHFPGDRGSAYAEWL